MHASAGRHAVGWAARGGGWGGGVQEVTYLQVQAQGDEALPHHIQPVEVVSLAHQLLPAVGMVLQGDQAAAQQVGFPLGHQSIYTRSSVLIKAAVMSEACDEHSR